MTCVVGLVNEGNVYMAADSLGGNGSGYITLRKDPKVFRRGPFLIGYTSSFRMGQLLRFNLEVDEREPDLDIYEFMCTKFIEGVRSCLKDGGYTTIKDNEETIGSFLVGYNGRLFNINPDLQVGEAIKNYDAVGHGEQIALGSVFSTVGWSPRERIILALEAASEFSAYVKAPFVVDILKEDEWRK